MSIEPVQKETLPSMTNALAAKLCSFTPPYFKGEYHYYKGVIFHSWIRRNCLVTTTVFGKPLWYFCARKKTPAWFLFPFFIIDWGKKRLNISFLVSTQWSKLSLFWSHRIAYNRKHIFSILDNELCHRSECWKTGKKCLRSISMENGIFSRDFQTLWKLRHKKYNGQKNV